MSILTRDQGLCLASILKQMVFHGLLTVCDTADWALHCISISTLHAMLLVKQHPSFVPSWQHRFHSPNSMLDMLLAWVAGTVAAAAREAAKAAAARFVSSTEPPSSAAPVKVCRSSNFVDTCLNMCQAQTKDWFEALK